MPTAFPELFAALAAPFDPREIQVRDAERGGGRKLRYVRAQTVKNRLDTVLGPENWWTAYTPWPTGVECVLTLRLPDGACLAKAGAGQGKDLKAAFSDALKRAAEEFGVGRHLRELGLPRYAAERPSPSPAEPRALPPPEPAPRGDARTKAPARKPGPAFLDWLKAEGAARDLNLVHWVSAWGNAGGYPSRIGQWTEAQARAGYREVERKLATIGDAHAHGDAHEPELVGAGAAHAGGRR